MTVLLMSSAKAPASWGSRWGILESPTVIPGQWQPGSEEPSFSITFLVTRTSLCGSPVRLPNLYSVHSPGKKKSVKAPASQ